MMNPEVPANNLPFLPPSADVEAKSILKKAIAANRELARAIVSLLEQTTEMARKTLPRTTYSRELIELVFAQPYVKIEHVVSSQIAERRTASKYLKQLEDVGVLSPYKAWKETIFINRPLMDLLNKTG